MMKKRALVVLGLFVLVMVVLGFGYIRKGIPVVYELLFNKEIELKSEKKSNTTNVLLLGRGGGKHDGPNLTDTIILANINSEKKTVYMFSIPRDLWVPELKTKVNEAYAIGQEKNKQGTFFARKVVEKVTGQQIDYVAVIDFTGFVKLVDFLGGVDVQVERSFDDYEYPITGKENDLCGHTEEELPELATSSSMLDAFPCRFKHISFQKGVQHMDGQTALEFVRSRHAQGPEGTDFARGRRQQAVISAVREKALSLGILLNPVKVVGMYNILKDNIDTTITTNEYDDFIKLAQKMENPTIKSFVIGESDDQQDKFGLLLNPEMAEDYKYQWVLIPRAGNGDFGEVKEFIDCVRSGSICEITETTIVKNPKKTEG